MVFKHDPGFAGIVTDSTNTPVEGIQIQIYDPSNKLLANVITDEDGFYFFYYKHTGKAATYTIKVVGHPELTTKVTIKANQIVQVDFKLQ